MNKRTVTSRNLAGGFIGGALGILAFSWIPALLPVGCLFGVIAGFWYQEIAAGFSSNARTLCRHLASTLHGQIFTKLGEVADGALLSIRKLGLIGRALSAIGRGMMRQLRWLGGWSLSHPMVRLQFIRMLLVIAFVTLNGKWMAQAFYSAGTSSPTPDWYFLSVMLGAMAVLVAPVVLFMARDGNLGRDQVVNYYRQFETYASRLGLIKVLAKDIALMSLVVLYAAAAGVVIVPGVFFFLALLVASLFLSAAYCMLGAIYRVALRGSHWPCFAVTLVVTSGMAIATRNHLGDATLWLVALLSGTLSGLASEGFRRGYLRLARRYPPLAITDPTFEGQVERIIKAVVRPLGRIWPVLDFLERQVIRPAAFF